MRTLITVIALAAGFAMNASYAAPVPRLHSAHAVVFDATNQEVLLAKDADTPVPFASITKLLTAMVALDAHPDLKETLSVQADDVDMLKHSSSRVPVGTDLSREDMLHLALMSSENRAASALSHNYPGGQPAFVAAMNEKAKELGMVNTHVEEPTGLSPHNHSTARDLVHLVLAAAQYKPITQFTTSTGYVVPMGSRMMSYHNTDALVGKPQWNIELSKTGYINEAGRCLVMKLLAGGKDLVVVLLDAPTSGDRIADARAIKRWITGEPQIIEASYHRRSHSRHLGRTIRVAKYHHRIKGTSKRV
jgi:D-alanyl-D-alanine endopeptidase (penicillin-binding protein 7)